MAVLGKSFGIWRITKEMSAHRAQIHSHRDKKTRRSINALPDGCKTACLGQMYSQRGFSLSVCLSVIGSSWCPSFSCTFGQRYWRRGQWRGLWSSGDRKVCSWWQIHTDRSHSAGWLPSIRSRRKKNTEKVALSFSTTNCWQTFQWAIINSKLGLHNLG